MTREQPIHPCVVRIALGVGGGMLYAASLPPIGAWPLAWLALSPLCLACRGVRAGAGAIAGISFGLTAAILTSPWFPGMIADYFAARPAFAWPLALVGWTFCGAAYHAGLGAWLAWAMRCGPVAPIVVGAGWWVIEWARTHALVGNPWALLAYSQIGFLPLAQLADTLGPYGLGASIAAVGAAIAGLLRPTAIGATRARNASTIALILSSSIAYGTWRMTEVDAPPLYRAAIIQSGSANEDRSAPALRITDHLTLTNAALRDGVGLVLWPELALDFYLEEEPGLRSALVRGLRDLDVALIAGGYGIDATRTRATNSVFLVSRDGVHARYDKNRLMAFSETNPLPFDLFLPDTMTAGDSTPLLREEGIEYGVAICSEAMFPDHVRALIHAGARVIIAPSVDRWFASEGGRRQQLEAVAMRAIESRRFVLRPTETGISAAIDPLGQVVARAPVDQPASFVARYAARDDLTLYSRFGDLGVLAALALLAGDAMRRRRRFANGGAGSAEPGRGTGQAAALPADAR